MLLKMKKGSLKAPFCVLSRESGGDIVRDARNGTGSEYFQCETLSVSNHTVCRVTEKHSFSEWAACCLFKGKTVYALLSASFFRQTSRLRR